MEYFLLQKERGHSNPLNIILKGHQTIIGSDYFPILKQYPDVLTCHAEFDRRGNKYYVKSLHKSGKVYLNGRLLHAMRMYEVQINDVIIFGDANLNLKRFTFTLSVKKIETIDLLSVDQQNVNNDHVSTLNTKVKKAGNFCDGTSCMSLNRTPCIYTSVIKKTEDFVQPDRSSKSKVVPVEDPDVSIVYDSRSSSANSDDALIKGQSYDRPKGISAHDAVVAGVEHMKNTEFNDMVVQICVSNSGDIGVHFTTEHMA
ncbi:hypothetical protein TNCV_4946831 [Trichonephila clavipes]|nr:hypothetical protein TNCV_4946831 [Trichonephila clavipes]